MARFTLHNKYLKQKSAYSKTAYDNQRKYCLNFPCKTRKNYFANINIRITANNERSWKTVKHFSMIKSLRNNEFN